MSKQQQQDEKVIPLGVVFMAVGVIVLCTAVAIFIVLPRRSPQTPTVLIAATLPTANPELLRAVPNQPGEEAALLPETPLEADDESVVNFDDVAQSYIKGQPERIVIPDIDLDAPVSSTGLIQVQNDGQTYYQWQVPADFLAGWHNTSAPLGKAGNTVLNGHHNIHGEVFRDLIDLEEGAEIIVYDREQPFTYTVSLVEVLPERDQPLEVRIENAHWIAPTDDERLTLVTCWPYEDNSHRLVVVAYPANSGAEQLTGTNLDARENN